MIRINNLELSYKNAKVFNNISLEFENGNIYGLLGENGVGKTTLLKLMCGLQKADKGECEIDGFTPFQRKPEFLQKIFYLPEEVVFYDTTPEKYINSIGMFYPNYSHDLFNTLCKELEVDSSKKFGSLSYGQRKKALLASALSLRTTYLLLDEPTNGLDIPSKAQFRKVVLQHCQEDSTIIISTHQVKDVENLIDPIVILDHDEVLLNSSVSNITQKIYFDYSHEQNPHAYYSELLPGGYINVIPNINNLESNINIEALFNAVMRNKEQIKTLMK